MVLVPAVPAPGSSVEPEGVSRASAAVHAGNRPAAWSSCSRGTHPFLDHFIFDSALVGEGQKPSALLRLTREAGVSERPSSCHMCRRMASCIHDGTVAIERPNRHHPPRPRTERAQDPSSGCPAARRPICRSASCSLRTTVLSEVIRTSRRVAVHVAQARVACEPRISRMLMISARTKQILDIQGRSRRWEAAPGIPRKGHARPPAPHAADPVYRRIFLSFVGRLPRTRFCPISATFVPTWGDFLPALQ